MNSEMPPIVTAREYQAAIDAVQAHARAFWPRIASDLGLAAEGARFRQLLVNSRYQHVRSVQEVKTATGQRYVLRAAFDETNAAGQFKSLDRHQQASARLSAVPGVSSPSILWRDRDSVVVLMEFAEGDTAYRALSLSEYGFGDRAEVLRRIGHAVAALHRVSDVGEQRFWPKSFLKQVSTQAEAVRAGQFHVLKPKRFLGLCALLHRAGRSARGQVFRGAVEHGDLHLRNVMMSDTDVSFIDYSNHKGIFPHRDIANIWLSNCPDHLAANGRQPGFGGVASADWVAFEDGYGMRLTADPLFRFFFIWRLFKLWSALAARPSDQHRRTTDVVAGAQNVLDALLEADA
ncbi:phosphotransferase family protein [Phaeobacter inhibens]|uniref:phosphotransferase family protein n=1 Tax=Phaeobacter inhibens TaxID=221822 RepID=UPI0021A29B07|nr:aminoglycoside phosphotransferase family protein [Phaeobacter inhibens]